MWFKARFFQFFEGVGENVSFPSQISFRFFVPMNASVASRRDNSRNSNRSIFRIKSSPVQPTIRILQSLFENSLEKMKGLGENLEFEGLGENVKSM